MSMPLDYPETPKKPVAETLHGETVVDDYRWLETDEDPIVKRWAAAQESLTRAHLDGLPQRKWLLERLEGLLRYDDVGFPIPVRRGERVFYYAREGREEKYRLLTRADLDSEPVTLLNPNEWEDEATLDYHVPSFDGGLAAYGTARAGDENPSVRVIDVATGEDREQDLRGRRHYGVAWLADGGGFYYSCTPEAGEVPAGEEHYWHRVYLHKLDTPADEDVLVFAHDEVKEYFHFVEIDESGEWLVGHRRNMGERSEVYLGRAGGTELRPVITGLDALYEAHVKGGFLYVLTDKDAERYRLLRAPVEEPTELEEVIGEHPADKLAEVHGIGGRLYALYEHDAHHRLVVFSAAGEQLREVETPGLGMLTIGGSWAGDEVRLGFESLVNPPRRYYYDFAADETTLYNEPRIDFASGDYVLEQHWFSSRDGTRVPLFMARPRGLEPDGERAALLTGYGGFNISRHPRWNVAAAAWLEAGGVYVSANLRGGGEYGRSWHEAGMKQHKQNVFDDFLAAAQWLIDENYTRPERLAISGRSNGGLLVGAALTQRPELFGAVFCGVPLLDMLRYHLFGLANIWAAEYGSAAHPEQLEYLVAYSPYHNVEDDAAYPPVLITGGDNDARVAPLHARKMVARLQAADPEGGPFLLQPLRASGHLGGTTLSVQIAQLADPQAFLMYHIGLTRPGAKD
jgi:prolyl oligopeptidase